MRILVVSHFFPPDTTPGAARPHALATALADLGHDVAVVTARSEPVPGPYRALVVRYARIGTHIKRTLGLGEEANLAEETASGGGANLAAFVRFAARFVEGALQYPDKYRAWIPAIRRAVHDGVPMQTPDIVIASSPPVSAAYAGVDLASHWRVPLLLDMRDLWTQNPYYRYGALRRTVDRGMERRLLRQPQAVAVPSGAFRDALRERYPTLDIRLIPTGVLAGASGHASRSEDEPVLRIGHFGQLEDWVRRDPLPAVRAAAALVKAGAIPDNAVRFDFFGSVGTRLRTALTANDLECYVRLGGTLARERVPGELARTDVGLLLMWPGDALSFPMKATEYMAFGKPIIVWDAAPNSEVRRVLAGRDAVFMCDTPSDLKRAIGALVEAKLAGRPLVRSPAVRARPFLASTMAEQFAKVARQVVHDWSLGEA